MLRTWWKFIKTVAVAVGVLLSFFAIIELIRAYQTLRDLHPVAGFIFLAVLFCGIVWIIGYYVITVVLKPAALKPPAVAEPNNPTNRELHHYGKYLKKYVSRLIENDALSMADRDRARNCVDTFSAALENKDDHQILLSAIERAEEEVIQPLLAELDRQAEKQIRNSTRDVMAAVAFSPYQAVDLLIVIYRNIAMVSRIVKIYNNRPRFRQQLRILSDTISVVATVNYLNLGKSMMEDLGSRVPIIGKSLDNIVQGIGAGLMTSVAGHAAMHRCRAFKKWSAEEAKANVREHVHEFYTDVKGIFHKDILPVLKNRLGEFSAKQWENIKAGIDSVLDETGNVIGKFIKEPLATVGNGVVSAGTKGGQAVIKTAVNISIAASNKTKEVGAIIFQSSKSTGIKLFAYSKDRTHRAINAIKDKLQK